MTNLELKESLKVSWSLYILAAPLNPVEGFIGFERLNKACLKGPENFDLISYLLRTVHWG